MVYQNVTSSPHTIICVNQQLETRWITHFFRTIQKQIDWILIIERKKNTLFIQSLNFSETTVNWRPYLLYGRRFSQKSYRHCFNTKLLLFHVHIYNKYKKPEKKLFDNNCNEPKVIVYDGKTDMAPLLFPAKQFRAQMRANVATSLSNCCSM